MGEGWTPLVRFSDNLVFKLDYLNPTGSFKDRGSTALISAVQRRLGIGCHVAEDSSGNAGASIAAYAARAHLKAKIYVPASVSGRKLNQIQCYGADVVKVRGERSDVTAAAREVEQGKHYIGHIVHPLFRDGMRTIAYELVEQLGWKPPGTVYVPVSAGTLLLGIIEGFRHLEVSGLVPAVPRIVACQTQQVSPLYHRFKGLAYNPPAHLTSIADALVSTNPPLLNLMSKRLTDTRGASIMVEEEEIMHAFTELAGRGFYVEPSSAVAYAAYKKEAAEMSPDGDTVVVLTGNGLKTEVTLGRNPRPS